MPQSIVEYVVNRKVAPIESFTVTLSPSAALNIFNSLDRDSLILAGSPEWKQFLAMRNEIGKAQMSV